MKPAPPFLRGGRSLRHEILGVLLSIFLSLIVLNFLTASRDPAPFFEPLAPPQAPSSIDPGAAVPDGIAPARENVAEAERRYGPGDPRLADALELLAQRLWLAGDLSAERPVVERALGIRKALVPRDDVTVIRTLHFMAEIQRAEGDYGAALQTRAEMEPMIRRVYGSGHVEMAMHLHALALIEEATGDVASSLGHARRALEIRAARLGPEDPLLAVSSNFVGQLLVLAGDPAGAEPLVRRAVSIWESALGPGHPDVARGLSNMAMILEAKGQPARARPFLERALAIRSKEFGPSHILVARSLAALGSLERRLGHPGTARALLERAVGIQERASIPTHPELAATLRELAGLSFDEGGIREALQEALRAEEVARAHFLLTAGGLSEREALVLARGRASGLDLVMRAASALATAGRNDTAASRGTLAALVRSRALVLDVMASRRRILALHADGEIASLVGSLRKARSRIAQLLLDESIQDSSGPRAHRLEAARQEADRLERALAGRSRDFRREQARERVGIDEVAASLPRGSALVSYANYEPEGGPQSGAEKAEYLAIVLRSGATAPAIVHLGSAGTIDEAVAAWRREVEANPHLEGSVVAEASYARSARRLAEAIWDPLADRLAGTHDVFVVPDGALHEVAFATLVDREGAYLLESGPLIHELAAERDLVASAEEGAPGRGLLALGDPDFDAGSGEASSAPTSEGGGASPADSGFGFVALPGARREAAEVAAAWKSGGETTVLTGSRATEAAFKDLAPGRRVLHLGTHAFFESALRGAGEASRPGGSIRLENPLRLSGLALAGANVMAGSPGGGHEDDGILTAEEIATMDLDGVEWAVLSACETAGGDVEAWEGILGLHRAFRIAGARTLIMSLWPVEDEATRSFMRRLYEARRAGLRASGAVRRASLGLLEAQRRRHRTTHPYYWGGFVAVGDGAP